MPTIVCSAERSAILRPVHELPLPAMTTQITTKRGTAICFSATLNDVARALDDYAFTLAYGAVCSARSRTANA